ncbi:hypothetical protein TNCT_249431 [Trichonephila clavata]|uniref:Uncharacterized protein n=1 Tax=Trichonephila clavata TaxID=2740835 RepID=A0A8X6KB62_TRICU|nr:hypothetical protein TNCT_249431 [Trichonephila clavata]
MKLSQTTWIQLRSNCFGGFSYCLLKVTSAQLMDYSADLDLPEIPGQRCFPLHRVSRPQRIVFLLLPTALFSSGGACGYMVVQRHTCEMIGVILIG